MLVQACSRSSSVSHLAHRLKRAQMQRLHSRRCSSSNIGSPAFFDFFTPLHRPPTLIIVALALRCGHVNRDIHCKYARVRCLPLMNAAELQ
jgi:hypothetical protein